MCRTVQTQTALFVAGPNNSCLTCTTCNHSIGWHPNCTYALSHSYHLRTTLPAPPYRTAALRTHTPPAAPRCRTALPHSVLHYARCPTAELHQTACISRCGDSLLCVESAFNNHTLSSGAAATASAAVGINQPASAMRCNGYRAMHRSLTCCAYCTWIDRYYRMWYCCILHPRSVQAWRWQKRRGGKHDNRQKRIEV
jgi:hypothetical protein